MLLPSPITAAGPRQIPFFIGTYTNAKGSKGIYRANLNPHNGKISTPTLCIASENPSYLAMHPNQKFLYAVHESEAASVSSYSVGMDHSLSLVNTESIGGSLPCHLSLDPRGRNLFVACYSGGIVSCLPVGSNGSLKRSTSEIKHTGTGPDASRQEGPHAHWVASDWRGRFVYTCDLGTDSVDAYRLNPRSGTLSPTKTGAGKVPGGDGPRHGAFRPDHRFLYVNGEMGDNVNVFKIRPHTGKLKLIHQIGTLPIGSSKKGTTTAEIQCHPSGKWLYVSNRGADTIAVFRIRKGGGLKILQIQAAGVKFPRGFEIEPSGKWLVVAGQNSNDLVSLKIDRKTGLLHPTGYRAKVGSPVCILFAKN